LILKFKKNVMVRLAHAILALNNNRESEINHQLLVPFEEIIIEYKMSVS